MLVLTPIWPPAKTEIIKKIDSGQLKTKEPLFERPTNPEKEFSKIKKLAREEITIGLSHFMWFNSGDKDSTTYPNNS